MPTIKEIAERAEVSYSTVSRALNNKKGVRPEVRESVLNLAREMKYFPDSSAMALVKKKVGGGHSGFPERFRRTHRQRKLRELP